MWHSSLDSGWILVAVWDDADPEEGSREKKEVKAHSGVSLVKAMPISDGKGPRP